MVKKILSFSLIVSILSMCFFSPAYAVSKEETEAAFLMEKVKGVVNNLGTGEKARAEVKLKDGGKVKGYIREASEESFVLMDSETNQAITIQYDQVQDIKKVRNTRNFKIALILTAGALGVLYIVKARAD